MKVLQNNSAYTGTSPLYKGNTELQDTSKRTAGCPSHIDSYTRPPLYVVPLYNTPCNGALCRKAPLYMPQLETDAGMNKNLMQYK